MTTDEKLINVVLRFQRNEITEYHIYSRLAKSVRRVDNSVVLAKIAKDELAHYKFFRKISSQDVTPYHLKVFFYYWLARIFGLTFSIKLLERGEVSAQAAYGRLEKDLPEIRRVIHDEEDHEHELIAMIQEDRLEYVGSIVLGLNDALVELTGTLAGLTFALQNSRLIAVVGLITGIAASLSMASSEYLSSKSEGDSQNALKSAIYTGIAYILTVIMLVVPYFFITNYFFSLGLTLTIAILIILVFNFYLAVAKDLNFARRFAEMVAISLGVALISFGIGFIVRQTLGVDV